MHIMKRLLIFLLLISQISWGQVNLGFGLKAYYPFSGNANDVSGNNNNPVFNNAALTSDRLGNPNSAYHFNGIDNYMKILNSPTLNMANKMSIAVWVKPTGFYTGQCYNNMMVMKGDGDYLPGNYYLRYADAYTGCTSPNPANEMFYSPIASTPIVQLNQWYSVIITSDGTTDKIYVNCQLKNTVPAAASSFTNGYDLYLGHMNNAQFPYWLNADLDEVRIYDRALTQDEVNILGGCASGTPVSGIINSYTPVTALNPCNNKITVGDASTFNAGDTVLMIQMKGAVVDSSNTASFGNITDYKNAGNYEFNYINSKAGNIIELKNTLNRSYDIPQGKVQLIRVPYYNSVNIFSPLSCLPWNGSIGGVLVLNARDTIFLNANIDVSGTGFTGGSGVHGVPGSVNCYENQFYYPQNTDLAAQKGEGIASLSINKSNGKGNIANAGGGGNSHNAGGGGGANASTAGFGGYQYEFTPCNVTVPFDNRGIAGLGLTYNNSSNRIFLGGGGGAGHANNPELFFPKGGNGAGIAIIFADKIQTNAFKIIANGSDATACGLTTSGCHEAMGGGGGGGVVSLKVNTYLDNTTIETKGGKGGDLTAIGYYKVGPGGGGSGGVAWLSNASLPALVNIINSGGMNGVCTGYGNDPWGSTAGQTGTNILNQVIPIDNIPFKKNIDSVRIKDSLTTCFSFDFKGLGFTNTNPITNWQWFFGDGATANTQNTSHTYLNGGTFTVKLVVTDINGCSDSITTVVTTSSLIANAGNDTAVCSTGTVAVTLHAAPATTYAWTPAIYLNNPSIQNPVASISSTTRFYLTVTNLIGCSAIDSVTITVNPTPTVKTLNDTSVCKNSLLVLTTTTGLTSYHWSPGIYVSDSTISNPAFTGIISQTLYVTGNNANGCAASDTINITVKPLPVVKTIADTTICSTMSLTLFTSGAQSYTWTPVTFLSNPNIANPVYSGNQSLTYFVTGIALNGCAAKDTVAITVHAPGNMLAPPNKTMCSKTSVQLDGYNGNTVKYLWSPGTYLSATNIIDPIAFPPITTLFKVVISDLACNYDSSFNVLVTVGNSPQINAGKSNDIDCANHSSQLHASGGISYNWTPATGLSNSSIPNPIVNTLITQQYVVLVTNAEGCSGKDSVTVFSNLPASLARFMPNSFTPNGDGLNDCYGLKNWMHIEQLQFIIFDRWGEKVFSTNDPNKCWDGNYKGKPALAGAYVYYIKAQTKCGMEEQKGTLILMR